MLIERLGTLVRLLHQADSAERRAFYHELGLRLAYERVDQREKVSASLGVGSCVSEGGLEQLLHGRRRPHHRSRTVAPGCMI